MHVRPSGQAGWIGGPRWDVAFFFVPALLALGLAWLALDRPGLAIALWWAWIVLLDGPHLMATISRTWAYPQERARFARVHRRAWLTFAPGLMAWGIGALSGVLIPFDLFLLTTTLWSIHHNVRQHYGIMAIYQWHARQPGLWPRLDKWMLYGSMWGMFALFLIGHPFNRQLMGIPQSLWAQLGGLTQTLGGGAFAVLGVGYMGSILWRRLQGITIKPALFVLVPVVAVQALTYGWIGRLEPLLTPKHPEQAFLLVSFVMGLIHSAEYLGIVLVAQRRRAARRADDAQRRASALLSRPALHYAAMLAASALLYVALNAARGAAPGWNLNGEQSHVARLFMALYWGVFFHHYYVDQHIWRVSSDEELRAELGLSVHAQTQD